MDPEKIYSMITEKSVAINDVPGGGIPDFTPDDAKHSLGGMKECEFNYCQYVFLLYDEKCKDLVNNVIFHYKQNYTVKNTDRKNIERLAKLACAAQRKAGDKIMDKDLYLICQFTKNSWRHKWKDVYSIMNNYLNELRANVGWHIYRKTQE